MAPRVELQELLEQILGSSNVYFQPPPNLQMLYPCIVYARDAAVTQFADNSPYCHTMRYQVTVIDRDPDSETPGKVAKLPMSYFDRAFKAENLNHDVYTLYF